MYDDDEIGLQSANPLFKGGHPVDFDLVEDVIKEFNLEKGSQNCGHATDLICRTCGSRGPFGIDTNVTYRVGREGVISAPSVPTWYQGSGIVCDCGFSSTIDEFFVAGLDRVLVKAGHREFSGQ